MEIKLSVACEIQYFELRIFYFNSYIYYLARGFIDSTRAFNLLTRAFSLPTHAYNLATRAFSFLTRRFKRATRGFILVTRRFELLIQEFKLVTWGFELVTRFLLFHLQLALVLGFQALSQSFVSLRGIYHDPIYTLNFKSFDKFSDYLKFWLNLGTGFISGDNNLIYFNFY